MLAKIYITVFNNLPQRSKNGLINLTSKTVYRINQAYIGKNCNLIKLIDKDSDYQNNKH